MADLVGQYLGRYYLTERLGEGGMATVYRGYDTRLERDVAVKIIRKGAFPPEILDQVLQRFEREAKSLARLSHPNIVKVHDYGEHYGSPYLVMEFLPGGTLRDLIGKPVPWQEAVRLLLPVARGVAYAHRRGILHRDIKPANILVADGGEPMLSDFGIAKLLEGEEATGLTRSGMAIGTPEYMAPEQWTGQTNPQSDLYSLAIVLYEMLTGRKPYVGKTPPEIHLRQATEPLPRPREFGVDLPEALEHVLIKALAVEPGDRYEDMNALIAALENLHANEPVVLPPGPKPPEEDSTAKAKPLLQIVGIISLVLVVVCAGALAMAILIPLIRAAIPAATPPPASDPSVTTSPLPVTEPLGPSATPAPTLTPARTSIPAKITDAQDVTMHLVPAGEFTMGIDADAALAACNKNHGDCQRDSFVDGEPPHQIYLDAFYLDKYEVTNARYKACVDAGVCDPPQETGSGTRSAYYGESEFETYPVLLVDWTQAAAYCDWRDASLPTEAQWEKAARGTDGRTYPWGNDFNGSFANHCDKQCALDWADSSHDDGYGDTAPVGSYESGVSPYGIYDLAGNVSEWVADWYSETYYQTSLASNPVGPATGQSRVIRGGAWRDWGGWLRAPGRTHDSPDAIGINLGFRCARSVP